MRASSIEAIARALSTAGVRYLVVGGLAVNAHGYGRATFNIDLVVELTQEAIGELFNAVSSLGYQPLVPITPAAFGDRATRERLVEEKGMVVLQLYSDQHRETRIDVFASEPFDLQIEYERALVEELSPGLAMRFVALDTLIEMKAEAGRGKDLDDVEHLRWLNEDQDDDR